MSEIFDKLYTACVTAKANVERTEKILNDSDEKEFKKAEEEFLAELYNHQELIDELFKIFPALAA